MIIDFIPIFKILAVVAFGLALQAHVVWFLTDLAADARQHPEYNGWLANIFRRKYIRFDIHVVGFALLVIGQILANVIVYDAQKAAINALMWVATALAVTIGMATAQSVRAAAQWFRRKAIIGNPPVEQPEEK